jgi:hypothetical protein
MNDTPILTFGMILMGFSSLVTHFCSVLHFIKYPMKFIKITEKLNVLDSIFHQTLSVRKKQLCALVAQLLIGCVLLGSYLCWATFYTDDAKITSDNVAVKFICVFGDYIIVLQYINLVLFTRQYFCHLNVQLYELEHLCLQPPLIGCNDARMTTPKPARSQLREQILMLLEFCDKLLDTARCINSAYSLQILLIVAKIFFHITFCLYLVFIVTCSSDYDKQYNIHALFFILWTAFQLVFIITSCDYTKTEVSVDCYCESRCMNVFK